MQYEAYHYHGAPTEPTTTTDKRIFGLELEIDDFDYIVHNLLDDAIEMNYLTAPVNEHITKRWKVLEEDSSVFKEIIFPADEKENLLKRIKNLNSIGFHDGNICNSSGTSAHIHLNRRYLTGLGITETNIFKMFEFLAPVIYAISGRNRGNFIEWAEPRSRFQINNINWKERADNIRHLSPSCDRYTLVNCTNSATIELRGFSNKNTFNYYTIKLYLDFVDLCIDLSEYMVGKLYINEYQYILTAVKEFFKNQYEDIYTRKNIRQLLTHDEKLTQMVEQISIIKNNILYYTERYSPLTHRVFSLLEIYWNNDQYLGLKEDTTLNYGVQGFKNFSEIVQERCYYTIKGYYMDYYRNLKHEQQVNEEEI